MEASRGVRVPGCVPPGFGFRLSAMALAVACALGLSACGGAGANVKPAPPSTPPAGVTGGTGGTSGTGDTGGGGGSGGTGSAGGEIDVDANTVTVDADNLTGAIDLIKGGAGTLALTGTNSYTGSTQVLAGSLYVDGDQSGATGAATVASGATLGGKGILGGDVAVADGATLAPGSSGALGTLTVNGNLTLSSGANLAYDFAAPTASGSQSSDLVEVKGNLTLDGTLNVNAASGSMAGPGVYRLLDYGGALVDNGLDAPTGLLVQTGISHQVNLVNAQGMNLRFWDGDAGPPNDNVINGGSGTWQNGSATSRTNWTDASGTLNTAFSDGSFAVFQAAPGTVTVDASHGDVMAAGMQFASNGYVVQGDPVHLVGSAGDTEHSIIRVGDGSAAGAGYTATINSVLTGNSGLVKADAGTLFLGGDSTYTGGTTVDSGMLQIGNGGTSGSIIGDVNDNASLAFNRSDVATFGGIISGTGSLTQAGTGTLVLTGNNTYSGGTNIGELATLQIGNGGTTGSITGNVVNNNFIEFNRSDNVVFGGNITGTGTLIKDGAGMLALTGDVTEDGTGTIARTTIANGTLQIGNGGTTGSIAGYIVNNGSLVFNRSDTSTFNGTVTGTGSITQAGTGTLVVTNEMGTYGGFTIDRGTLQIGNGGLNGSIYSNIVNNGTLVVDFGNPGGARTASGVISGTGNFIKEGDGGLIIANNNTYTGGTLISAGTLILGSANMGWVVGDITNNGVLAFERTDDVTFDKQVTGSGLVVVQPDHATLTITGEFNQTGGTRIDNGTLQIGNGGTSGSIAGSVIDNATLAFNRSDDVTYGNAISGNGKVVKLGTSTVTLAGVDTYQGETLVTDGMLRIASGASLKSTVDVGGNQANASLRVDQGGTASRVHIEDGATLDNAGLVHTDYPFTAVDGVAVTVLNHDGGVIETVSQMGYVGAAVSLGPGSTLNNGPGSSIRGAVGVASAGVVNNNGGTISGVSDDAVDGDLTVLNNTNGGQIASGSEAPPLSLGFSTGVYTSGDNATVNNLSASSILAQRVGVDLSKGGTVNNDGGSVVSALTGILTSSGSGTIATVNNTNGARISGSQIGIKLGYGGVINNGAGSTIETTAAPSGDCSVTPACAVYVPVYSAIGDFGSNGVLTLFNAGSIVGDVQMDPGLANSVALIAGGYIHGALKIGTNAQSTLTLDGDAGTTQLYSNAVTGATTFAGNLIKQGAGAWVLDNNALQGVATTSINAGSLRAAQALSGNVNVNGGGTLDGVPGVMGSLANVGKVAAHGGDSTIGGNYTQGATGTLAVSLGSKLAVRGGATLGGTLEVTGAEGGYISNTHTDVLTATGGINGTFNQLVKDTGVIFTATSINYDANSVWLDTTGLNITSAILSRGGTFSRASLSSAQRVQNAFTQMDSMSAIGNGSAAGRSGAGSGTVTPAGAGVSSVSDDFVKAAGQFQQAPTVQAAQSSLQSLSGQLHAASAAMTFEAIDASSRALADRFDDLLGKKIGYGMWTHNLSTGGDMGRAGFDGVGFQLSGWMLGNDQQIGSNGVAGFAFGQSQGQQQLDQSYDNDRTRNTEGMFYGGALNGNWYTQGRVGFGHFQQTVNRQLQLGTSAQGVGTVYGGNYNVAYGETGLNLNLAGSRVIPFVNVEYATVRRDGFSEQGAGGFGLQSSAQTLDRWQAGVGMRADHHWDFGGGRALAFKASAQFQRTLASRGDVFSASFVGLQQWQPLVGIGLSRYSGVLNVGLDAALSARTSLNFGYDYETGQRDQAQTVSLRFVEAF